MSDTSETIPIKPMRCPRCNRVVIFKDDDTIECEVCGELYFDNWLGIYRVKPESEEED